MKVRHSKGKCLAHGHTAIWWWYLTPGVPDSKAHFPSSLPQSCCFPLLVLSPTVSAPWLSVLAWSTCCSGTCWDKSSVSTSTCSFGWIFGVSPAAPRTRVRESLISCPGPRDRLAGPAFCPAHRSWKRVWTHILLLPDEKSVQSPGCYAHLSGVFNDYGIRVRVLVHNALESSAVCLLFLSLAGLLYLMAFRHRVAIISWGGTNMPSLPESYW